MSPSQIEFYNQCIRNGCTPKFAEMLTYQQPPGVVTDATFVAAAKERTIRHVINNGTYADRMLMRKTLAAARKQGYKPNPNDIYEPQLAKKPGDPAAFIPAGNARGHVKAVCEARGMACEGSVNVRHRQPEHDPLGAPKGLAEDLISEKVDAHVQENPALQKLKKKARRTAYRNLREKIIHTHGS